MSSRMLGSVVGLMFAVGVSACGDDGTGGPSDPALEGCDEVLTASGDDYAAVQQVLIEAPSQTAICFEPGEYRFDEELSLSTRGITIRGVDRGADRPVVFDFGDQQGAANGMLVTGSDFTIENLTLRNSPGDGIRVEGAENVIFRGLTVTWDGEPSADNGAYAIYPVGCTNVLVEDSEVSGASDAGIYVGQSTDAIVRNNRVHGNVAGIEIENTTNAEVHDNEAWDNAGGILVFNLPNLPVKTGSRTRVYDNTIDGNNRPNFAPEGNIVASVPTGTGAMILAADEIELHGNAIENNDTAGLLVVSFFMVEALTDTGPEDPAYDPYPETIWIHGNTYDANGTDPDATARELLGRDTFEDILWDGVTDPGKDDSDGRLDLCIRESDVSFRDFNLLSGLQDQSTDLSPHECEHDSLPPLSL